MKKKNQSKKGGTKEVGEIEDNDSIQVEDHKSYKSYISLSLNNGEDLTTEATNVYLIKIIIVPLIEKAITVKAITYGVEEEITFEVEEGESVQEKRNHRSRRN